MSSNNGNRNGAGRAPSMPQLAQVLRGRRILLTGSTGFLGKVFLYELLRWRPELDRIYLLIRGDRRSSLNRLRREILDSPVMGPLRDEFHPEHHPSYIEFFHRCLEKTTDGTELEKNFEAEFARNPTYIHMYRYGHAYHGAHPFFMWYWGEPGRQHLGRIIAAGCEHPEVAARMGWEAADTLDEAIAMATSELGRSATITYLHLPPLVIADVE